RERFADLTPMQRERIRGLVRERLAELTPAQRERLGGIVRERFADLTPMQRERVKGLVRERLAELTPAQRERLDLHAPCGRRRARSRHGRLDVGRQLALRPLHRRAYSNLVRIGPSRDTAAR